MIVPIAICYLAAAAICVKLCLDSSPPQMSRWRKARLCVAIAIIGPPAWALLALYVSIRMMFDVIKQWRTHS